jgi:lactate 2-monooxygenase
LVTEQEADRRANRERYSRGEASWPVGSEDWAAAAADVLTPGAFDWIAGGSGEELTLRANRAAFEARRLRPRMLTGVATCSTDVDILGTRSPAPFLLAPIGGQTVAHPEGELASARAAASLGVPLIVSTAASHSMEDVAAELQGSPAWFQLYYVSDKEVTQSFIARALASGYEAIVLTVDSPMVGWRDRDRRNAYIPFLTGEGIAQYATDPVFRSRLPTPPEDDPAAAGRAVVDMFPNLALTWDDLAWVRAQVPVPLLIKGILSGDDALRARAAGFDGYIVSNHGGRQLDGVVAALDALVEVRAALGEEAVVLVDGGVRRGPDVVKALAMGADAVLVGRPYVYGLAVGGRAGVERVVSVLLEEVHHSFALAGLRSPADADSSLVVAAPPR